MNQLVKNRKKRSRTVKKKKVAVRKKARKKVCSNPRRRDGVVIGDRALSLTYAGGKGKKNKSKWIHPFETAVRVLGMKDGSIKLESTEGLPLWDYFK